ncbi:MAG: hypothetical protein KDE56_27105, partial [Anaerolineales bacterium]|nr:hypothetical protein [Anaerolineales bacterium]
SSYAWGGSSYAWGAPVMSNDGQVSILPLEGLFDNNFDYYTLQSLDLPPTLPSWLTLTGQAYRVKTDGTLPNSVILFRYLARDVPAGEENGLHVYYSPDNGQTWQRLETRLNVTRNHASAKLQGDGIYALIATIELAPFSRGWNNFGYPAQTARSVAEALASIEGKYTSIYNYDTGADEWYLYDATVGSNFSNLVNDLTVLEYTKGYWLYATEDVTGYIGVDAGVQSSFLWGQVVNFQLPPATYYGWVTAAAGFIPAAGMEVTAEIDGNICGQTIVQAHDGQLAYVLEVQAEKVFGTANGCGAEGRTVVFKVDGLVMDDDAVWDTSQAWLHSLSQVLVPAASPVVAISRDGDDVVLRWQHAAQNDNYEVWRSTSPYFAAGDVGVIKLSDVQGSSAGETLVLRHVGAAANGNTYFYMVRATSGAGEAVSNRVGKFVFVIVPGGS